MALLVDKHRPRSLDALSYHPELSDRLRALVRSLRTQFEPKRVATLTSLELLGSEWRLPTFTHLWTFWRGQEDENLGDTKSALWTWC
jgi:hypothetical protein